MRKVALVAWILLVGMILFLLVAWWAVVLWTAGADPSGNPGTEDPYE